MPVSELEKYAAGGYLPASFLDWDGRVSAVVFTIGCNFRCPWCHNGALAEGRAEPMPVSEILSDIARRAKFLDGVCVSGGEPTLWDGLEPFIRETAKLGLPVKLDTNGSNPDIVRRLLAERLIAHVAMDVKAPLDADSYWRVARSRVPIENIRESIRIIKSTAPSWEFRTTWVPSIMTPDDLRAVREYLNDDARWFVQCFKPVGCLDAEFLSQKAADPQELERLLPGVTIRG